MFEELLPPDGVMVPSEILYNKSLSVGLKTTWMQLRGLAGEYGEMPVMAISALCEILGKSRTTIYDHLSQLNELGLLQWQPYGRGRLSVRFMLQSDRNLENVESENSDNLSGNPDVNSLKLIDKALIKELKTKSKTTIKKLRVRKSGQSFRETGPEQESRQLANDKTPAEVYREVMHLTANRLQREEMDRAVSDVELWRQTLRFWMLHNWNPFNVPGLLDMYARGGPRKIRQKAATRECLKQPLGDHSEQRERDRREARRIIAEARQKRRLAESASQPGEG
jgi:hypothetical protein